MGTHLTLSLAAAPGAPVHIGGTPLQIAVGDFDGDGHLDVATANNSSANLSFVFGDGKGSFSPPLNVPMAQPNIGPPTCQAYAIVAGEFNGVAPIDVAATCTDGGNVNGGMVVLGDTMRKLLPKPIAALQAIKTQVLPESIAAGDFNHDGKLDLVIGGYNQPGQILILNGNGDGTFAVTPNSFPIVGGGSIESLAVGDLNLDGRDDFVASNDALGEIHVFLQATNGTIPTTPATYNGISASMGVRLSDVDHDGWPDILACDAANWGIVVMINGKDGTFPTAAGNRQPPEYGSTSANPWHVFAGDLDKDGALDLVSTAYNANALDIFLGKGDGTFGKPTPHTNAMEPNDVVIADFNADGLPDVVYIEGFDPGGVFLLLNTSH
jgi:hypothetical protein